MEKIILVKPDLSYSDEIIKYKEESLKEKQNSTYWNRCYFCFL